MVLFLFNKEEAQFFWAFRGSPNFVHHRGYERGLGRDKIVYNKIGHVNIQHQPCKTQFGKNMINPQNSPETHQNWSFASTFFDWIQQTGSGYLGFATWGWSFCHFGRNTEGVSIKRRFSLQTTGADHINPKYEVTRGRWVRAQLILF